MSHKQLEQEKSDLLALLKKIESDGRGHVTAKALAAMEVKLPGKKNVNVTPETIRSGLESLNTQLMDKTRYLSLPRYRG